LSWWTILSKREAFKAAFADFDPVRVAAFGDGDVERLRQDASIVRHRGKIEATIGNARALLRLRSEGESFRDLLWSVVDGRPLVNVPASLAHVPNRTERSDRLSALLRARGFRFVGSTICYSFMQAAGLVNDHVAACFRAGSRSD
jgi:DNA-3-methyladenine glycosylase I